VHAFFRAHARAVPIPVLSPSSSHRPVPSVLQAVLAAGCALSFVFGAALVTSVITAAPASAHAALVKITPAAGARLTKAPAQVVAEFNEPVSSNFATVVVTTAAGAGVARGKATVLGGKVTQALSPDLASGDYAVAFRVTSDDGHPVTGESKFTLTLAPGSSPATSTGAPSVSRSAATPSVPVIAARSAADPAAEQGGWLTRNLVPASGAVGLLVIGAGVLLWERRRR
jgi:methionine-rich copper-binding protein CopC